MFRSVGQRIIVTEHKPESVTASGLVIPATAQEEPNRGFVIDVGVDVKENICVGDEILYTKYNGELVQVLDEMVVSLHENEILAVIT